MVRDDVTNRGRQDVVLFKDLTGGRATDLMHALAAAEPVFTYRSIPSLAGLGAERVTAAAVVFYALTGMTRELFRDLETCARSTATPMAVVTDSDDLAMYTECYARGVRGVLPTSMLVSNAALAIHLISRGGLFRPPNFILAGL